MLRLSEKTLSQLPAGVARPAYDRSKVVPSIVHLGIGAFHRAHQAMFTDAVLASGDLAWGIVGAGIISADMKNALLPQDCLYALAEMGADGEQVKVIGSIVDGTPGRRASGPMAIRKARGGGLENGFRDVVAVPPIVDDDVQVAQTVGSQRLPELGDQFAIEIADLGAGKGGVEDEVRSAAQIDGHGSPTSLPWAG